MTRKPGRPRKRPRSASENVRHKLLNAAGECLREHPTTAVGIRDIAARAGVNSAMVSYYFESKEGLFAALLDSAIAPLMTLDAGTLKSLPPEQRGKVLISRFAAIYQATPWLPRLIVDEVVGEQGGLRDRLIVQIGARIARLFKRFIRLQQQDGYFRADLDVRQTSITLLGMMAFPLIATPLLQTTHGLKPRQLGGEKWIGELCRFLEEGCRTS